MAIKKSVTIKDNFGEDRTFPDCYHQVVMVSGSKDEVEATLFAYKNAEKKNVIFEKKYRFNPSMTAENFIAQAYGFVKALPEYQDSIDC